MKMWNRVLMYASIIMGVFILHPSNNLDGYLTTTYIWGVGYISLGLIIGYLGIEKKK